MPAVRLPADIDLADRLAFGLTGRQLATLAASAICAFAAEQLVGSLAPLPVALAAAAIAAAAGIGLAFARHGGLEGERLALALARHLLLPRRLVLAPEGLPTRLAATPGPRLAALEPPVKRIETGGLVELSDGSRCMIFAASGTSFALRSHEEQEAFVAAFGRLLNGLHEPLQIHVRREAVTLDAQVAALRDQAGSLDTPLALAAVAHAEYLHLLGHDEQPLTRRRILLIMRTLERESARAETVLIRRAAAAGELLRGAGVGLERLDGAGVATLLSEILQLPAASAGSHRQGVIGARG